MNIFQFLFVVYYAPPQKKSGCKCSCRIVPPPVSPAHNFVIRSWILKIFHRNDHHLETMYRTKQLGGYLEGQGHSMTLQLNLV